MTGGGPVTSPDLLLDRTVKWLVDTGFPFDWSSKCLAPRGLRLSLAGEWHSREPDATTVEDWLGSLDLEQGWSED